MTDARPFQFSIFTVLTATTLVAGVVWAASGAEWGWHPLSVAYLTVGCGQIILAPVVWAQYPYVVLARVERRKATVENAWYGFFLSMPTWLVYVAFLAAQRLDVQLDAPVRMAVENVVAIVAWAFIVLHVPAAALNLSSWFTHVPKPRDGSLRALRLLNLANTGLLLIAGVYQLLSPAVH